MRIRTASWSQVRGAQPLRGLRRRTFTRSCPQSTLAAAEDPADVMHAGYALDSCPAAALPSTMLLPTDVREVTMEDVGELPTPRTAQAAA